MQAPEQPQIYLITPPEIDPDRFAEQLARVLDGTPIACVRLALASRDETLVSRAADTLREVAHARDVALVIGDHVLLAQRLGLDGVHLGDGARTVRFARKTLGPDAIVGCFCAGSRHDGMSAAEAGADYVSFGPVGASALGDGSSVDDDLLQWWSEMIEIPVVAEGGLTEELMSRLAPFTDFFGLGEEIWSAESPLDRLMTLSDAMART